MAPQEAHRSPIPAYSVSGDTWFEKLNYLCYPIELKLDGVGPFNINFRGHPQELLSACPANIYRGAVAPGVGQYWQYVAFCTWYWQYTDVSLVVN